MKDFSNIDLRTSCIFDLTDDKKVIITVLSYWPKSKEEYLNGLSDTGRILDMTEFAEITKNEQLLSKLEQVFESELAAMFDE